MTKIIVDKDLLDEKLSQSKKGDLIELRIVASEISCGNYSPAFLHVAVIHNKSDYVDLESVDEYLSDVYASQTA